MTGHYFNFKNECLIPMRHITRFQLTGGGAPAEIYISGGISPIVVSGDTDALFSAFETYLKNQKS